MGFSSTLLHISSQLRRSIAIGWLVVQTLSVSMFAFEACCFPTSTVTATASGGSEDECPMKHEDGAACPMHRAKPKETPCAVRAACHADMVGVAAVFVSNAVPRDVFELRADDAASAALIPAPFALPQALLPADTPPPRA